MKLGLGLRLGAPESEETLGIAGQLDPLTCACVLTAFTPLNISGITAWLDPATGVALSGSDITTWTDKVNGVVFTGGAVKPTINASNAAFANKPTAHWASSADQNLTSSQLIVQPASYFAICKCDDQGTTRTLINGHIIKAFNTAAAGVLLYAGGAGGIGIWGHSLFTGGVHSLAVIVNGANTEVWFDGVQLAVTEGVQNVGSSSANAAIGDTAGSWVGDMAEIIMWSGKAVTAQDVADLHAWAQRNCGAV